MLTEHKNTKKQGDEGLGLAIAYFCGRGDCVNIPLTDSQDYDLVADCGGTLRRIQVKTTTYKTSAGRYQANLSIKGGNRTGVGMIKRFDGSVVDFLFVATPDGCYLIPTQEFDNGSTITLGKKYDAYRV